MSVPAPTVAADLQAALGKSIEHETNTRLVDDRVEKAAMVKDNRSAEEALGAGDKWSGKTPEELAADPDALANMSSADLMRAMGLEINDKSDSALPEGDATVHEIDTALAEGKATALPEPGSAAKPAAAAPAPASAPASTATSDPAASAAAPASTPSAAAPAQPSTDELFIESRNGQGRIRYEVLQNERERRQAAEAELARLREQLNERAVAAPAAQPAAPTESEPAQPAQSAPRAPTLLTEQQIASLRERYDDSVVDILVENNRIAVEAYERAARAEATLVDRDTTDVVKATQDYIDQDPLLSKWQAGKDGTPEQALWLEAVATDDMLKALPGWADKPWQDRIAEATRRVAVAHGIEIPKPNSMAPAPSTAAQPSLQDRADAAFKAARGHVQLPVSHSDLPAGTPPAQSERDSVSELNVHQLYDKLLAMTPEKQAEYLARIA